MTAAGLETLKASMPHADLTEFEKDPVVSKISDLITVKTLVNYVEGKLAAA